MQQPDADLTYRPVGATRGVLPAGFDVVRRTRQVGCGRADFVAASDAVMAWAAQRVPGVRVSAVGPVSEGAEVHVRLGLGPLAISAPARVVYVVDEPRRRGFAYGTLPGHPVSGEESFVVEHRHDDTVWFTVTAFSLPARWFTRAAGPAGRIFQRLMAGRYLAAIRRATRQRG